MHYASFTIFYLVRTRNGSLSQVHLQNRSFIIKVSIIVSTMLKHCTFFNKFCFNECVCVYVYGDSHSQRPEKGARSPGAGDTSTCELGYKLCSSRGEASALNGEPSR